MSTCHANSPRDALRRLEALALLGDSALPAGFVRDQLTSALRLVVHVVRTDDGRRRVRDVVAVGPSADWRTGAGLEVVVGDGRLPEPPGVRP
jgi:pilus assembly protein CpaF